MCLVGLIYLLWSDAVASKIRAPVSSQSKLIAVFTQGLKNPGGVFLGQNAGSTEVSQPFLRNPAVQVAGSRVAKFGLTLGGGAKSLFHSFVRLLLGHGFFILN
jgi:hypothetical protein